MKFCGKQLAHQSLFTYNLIIFMFRMNTNIQQSNYYLVRDVHFGTVNLMNQVSVLNYRSANAFTINTKRHAKHYPNKTKAKHKGLRENPFVCRIH